MCLTEPDSLQNIQTTTSGQYLFENCRLHFTVGVEIYTKMWLVSTGFRGLAKHNALFSVHKLSPDRLSSIYDCLLVTLELPADSGLPEQQGHISELPKGFRASHLRTSMFAFRNTSHIMLDKGHNNCNIHSVAVTELWALSM